MYSFNEAKVLLLIFQKDYMYRMHVYIVQNPVSLRGTLWSSYSSGGREPGGGSYPKAMKAYSSSSDLTSLHNPTNIPHATHNKIIAFDGTCRYKSKLFQYIYLLTYIIKGGN